MKILLCYYNAQQKIKLKDRGVISKPLEDVLDDVPREMCEPRKEHCGAVRPSRDPPFKGEQEHHEVPTTPEPSTVNRSHLNSVPQAQSNCDEMVSRKASQDGRLQICGPSEP